MARKKQIVTPECRCKFVNLWEPVGFDESDPNPKYSVMCIVEKTEKVFIAALKDLMRDAARQKWQTDDFTGIERALKDGDSADAQKKAWADELVGCCYFRASSKFPPGVIDMLREEMTAPPETEGIWRIQMSAFAWEAPDGRKGISLNLSNALYVGESSGFASQDDPAEQARAAFSKFTDATETDEIPRELPAGMTEDEARKLDDDIPF